MARPKKFQTEKLQEMLVSFWKTECEEIPSLVSMPAFANYLHKFPEYANITDNYLKHIPAIHDAIRNYQSSGKKTPDASLATPGTTEENDPLKAANATIEALQMKVNEQAEELTYFKKTYQEIVLPEIYKKILQKYHNYGGTSGASEEALKYVFTAKDNLYDNPLLIEMLEHFGGNT